MEGEYQSSLINVFINIYGNTIDKCVELQYFPYLA
jgi:hypothetical protein